MSHIFTTALKKSLLYGLYNEIKTNANGYYYFVGKNEPWENEEEAPDLVNSQGSEINARNNMVLIKKITVNDVAFIIPRYDWESGLIFDAYDDMVEDLEERMFYCLTANNRVYKCIDNNYGNPSTVQPYAASQNVFRTSDGYKWKYMYTIPISLIDKFTTSSYIPVINSITNEYYSRGSIYTATIANYGIGYSKDTKLEVIGNGYQKNNKLRVYSYGIVRPGSGYLTTPSITISDPYVSEPFMPSTEYALGQYIKHNNNIYEVVKSGITASIPPIHTCICNDPIDNGTTSLSFIGKSINAQISVGNYEISRFNISGFIGEIIMLNSGYGYDDENPPNVSISSPGLFSENVATGICNVSNGRITSVIISNAGSGYSTEGSYTAIIDQPFNIGEYNDFVENMVVQFGDKIKYEGYYYKALNGGTLSSVPPVHDVGSIFNGDVELQFIGENAVAIPSVFYGYGYSTPPIITISEPHLYNFNPINYVVGEPVDTNDLVKDGNNYYIVRTGGLLPDTLPTPEIGSGSNDSSDPNIAIVEYVKTIYSYASGIDVLMGDIIYTNTTPKQFYSATENITNLSIEPTHTTGTQYSMQYIPLSLPLITINTEKTAARFTPIIENTQIVGVICNDPGMGYTSASIIATESYYGIGSDVSILPNIVENSSNSKQEFIELAAVPGSIERIVVVDGGTKYSSPPQVVIHGDGVNCFAVAELINGSISKIEVISAGQNYSYATVEFIRDEQDDNTENINAIARPVFSPQDGHAKNAIAELYSNKLAISTTISADKVNGFTLDNEYRQFGIIKNPNKFSAKLRYDKRLGSACFTILCNYRMGENIDITKPLYDINNNEYAILDYTVTSNPVTHINLLLHASYNSKIVVGQQLYQAGRQIEVVTVDYPDIDKQSGELLMIDNRTAFLPNKEQSVVLKTIINL